MKGSPYALPRAVLAAIALLAPITLSAGDFAAPDSDFAVRVLAAHNSERTRMGVQPLRWSAQLSQEAQSWAHSLASRGALEHARSRDDTGENLWMGSANWFSPEQMVGDFVSERSAFRPGRFPNVSNTGNWADVGHYTQVIWPETRAVGCAVAHSGHQEVLVCRYWPAGNVYGERIG
jgi:hypothetical protein